LLYSEGVFLSEFARWLAMSIQWKFRW
jgi:hypothetical protein